MLRVPLLVALALSIAFGGGVSSAIWALGPGVGSGAISLGSWVAFPDAQTNRADPYAKAHRARDGRLLLGGAEGLAFTASTDADGQPLLPACDYAVSGTTPPARFWTLHTIGIGAGDARPAADLPVAMNAWTVQRAPDSRFVIAISRDAQPANWLAINRTGPYALVLTLLDTPTAGSSGLIDLAMPVVMRTGCRDA